MNLCQALVKPDCTKPKVLKAAGMTSALADILLEFPEKKSPDDLDKLVERGLFSTGLSALPVSVENQIAFVTIEFAGVSLNELPLPEHNI